VHFSHSLSVIAFPPVLHHGIASAAEKEGGDEKTPPGFQTLVA
jgi:hypothetical protein